MLKKIKSRVELLRRGIYSGALKESFYSERLGQRNVQLVHSRFNPRWLRQLKIAPQTILELGAYDGGDALRFAREFPECRVVSVEADPARYSIVCGNLAGERVETFNLAVNETDGPIDWYPATIDGDVRGQGSIFAHTDSYRRKFPFVEQQAQPQTVVGARLDSLCRSLNITEIDLLHMDIEAAENAALRSLGTLRPKAVFLEICDDRFVGGPSVTETHWLLTDLGYDLVCECTNDRFYVSRTACHVIGRRRRFAA